MLKRRMTTFTTAAAAATLAVTGLTTGAAEAKSSPRPTHLTAHSGSHGLHLTWRGGSSVFTVEQATNARFSAGRRTYRLHSRAHEFTPYGLTRGRTYWFRVRAGKGRSASRWSGAVHGADYKRVLPLRVMTYNILELSRDGQRAPSGARFSPWSKRRLAIARIIRHAHPDVVAIQEGSSWVHRKRGPRQVDDLLKALGGTYALAHTEIPPRRPHYFRTGRYILYRRSGFRAVGRGGHFDAGQKSWVAYQVLQSKATGARFLFTSSHLLHSSATGANERRYQETRRLIAVASKKAARRGIPVVYAGDFNSHGGPRVPFDGPAAAMRQAHIVDAKDVAQSKKQARFNSGNLYARRPPARGRNQDHVFAPAGVGVVFWREILRLSHGKFRGTIPSDHNPVLADLRLPY